MKLASDRFQITVAPINIFALILFFPCHKMEGCCCNCSWEYVVIKD